MSITYGVHWFRRDLRVAGNPALQKQMKLHGKNVLGIFCFDKKFLSRTDFSSNRFQFFLSTLLELKKELQEMGSDLLVLDEGPLVAFRDLFEQMQRNQIRLPAVVSWNRDYEPFSQLRDQKMQEFFVENKVESFDKRDHLLIEPHELHKDNGEGYQVYSPFARKWIELFQSPEMKKRVEEQSSGTSYLKKRIQGTSRTVFDLSWSRLFQEKIHFSDHLMDYIEGNKKNVTVEIPAAGSIVAYNKALEFSSSISNYGEQRDFPNILGTSGLSIYLKNGSITIPQIISMLDLKPYQKKKTGEDVYLSELIWREFYYHILYRHPQVENEEFIKKYRGLEWENNQNYFLAWKEGRTGFPIVDAGMRQLKQTGWMHNRVRMIVASFLTKDLLIDWRWGERYFMEQLLDGDLAPNNGGWQWAASTGCDPQPYFRIFNPWLQSQKFDPKGLYIRKYLPELEDIDAKNLHSPIESHKIYPKPIVDHKVQREKALALYKRERG